VVGRRAGEELQVEAGWPAPGGNSFITDRFCWKDASKAAWAIGDTGASGPGGRGRSGAEYIADSQDKVAK
jgi:hypothetical protein